MRKFYVYVHTCKANGKRYVGCTTQARPELRWQRGKGYQNNDHFYRAILKHGWNNFEHEVFEVESEEEMYRKEVELISFYHSNDPEYGYNNSVGGEKSALGYKHSEEARRKISEANKGKIVSEEARKHMSEARKGRPHKPHKPYKPFSEETRKRMSKARKGKTLSEETKRRIAEAMKGKPFSEEHRKHISESHKGKPLKPFSEEHKRHIAEARKGKPCSEETRKKISEANKKRCSDPEFRRKISEAKKGKPQPRVKISLPDGTIIEMSKQNLVKNYVNKGKEFEYVS